jgi:hypothetical protein
MKRCHKVLIFDCAIKILVKQRELIACQQLKLKFVFVQMTLGPDSMIMNDINSHYTLLEATEVYVHH